MDRVDKVRPGRAEAASRGRGGRVEKRAGIEQAEEVDTRKTQKESQGWEAGTSAPDLPLQSLSLCYSTPKTGVGTDATPWGWWLSKAPRGTEGRQARSPESCCQEMRPQSPNLSPGPPPWSTPPHPSPAVPPLIPQYMGSHLASVQGKRGGLEDRGNLYLASSCCVP